MDRDSRVLAICLGAIAAIGPLAMDMYLAAMPSMAADLGAKEGEIELSVMAFFVGFCAGQLVLGPTSDRTGRKPVVFLGLALFILASLGCVFAGSVHQLMAWRLIQGVGGSIGMVIAMSSVRDRFRGPEAAKMMGMVVIVLGLAPVIAPMLGSGLLLILPWQAIFIALALVAAAILVMVAVLMPETRSAEMRAQSRPSQALKTYGKLLFNRDFMPYAGGLALTQGGFFAYISAASVVMISYYGMDPFAFSVAFAINAIGLTVMAKTGAGLVVRIGGVKLARSAMIFRAVIAVIMLAMQLSGLLTLVSFLILCFLIVASLGLVMPSCSMLALDKQGANAGTASALMGAMGFGMGALGSLAVGLLTDGSDFALVLVLGTGTILAMLVAVLTFSEDSEPAEAHAH